MARRRFRSSRLARVVVNPFQHYAHACIPPEHRPGYSLSPISFPEHLANRVDLGGFAHQEHPIV